MQVKPTHTELPFAFLSPFQAKVVECPLCGSSNHLAKECPYPDGRPMTAYVAWDAPQCAGRVSPALPSQDLRHIAPKIRDFRRHEAPHFRLQRPPLAGAQPCVAHRARQCWRDG